MSDETLEQVLIERIRKDGPLTLETYMSLCLGDPEKGYYRGKAPIGAKGDFITAPEVSQLFGEMIAVWIIDIWMKLEKPARFSLVEAGPGRGTLMADILRTITKLAPDCARARRVFLIEIGDVLKEQQKETLSDFEREIVWISSLDDLPDEPLILVGNEFLDALPIRQFIVEDGEWTERTVDVDADGSLCLTTITTENAPALPPPGRAPHDQAVFEINLPARHFIEKLSNQIKDSKGAALLIDYGHLQTGFGDTVQAVRRHAFADILDNPGGSDLTAHVDFEPLTRIAQEAGLTVNTANQGHFLLSMGILERAGQLGAGKDVPFQKKVEADVERLAAPDKMGDLFKVLALTSKGITPHGF